MIAIAALLTAALAAHPSPPLVSTFSIVARDPESGRGNLSFARVKPLGGNRAFIGIAPEHHLAVFARRAQARP